MLLRLSAVLTQHIVNVCLYFENVLLCGDEGTLSYISVNTNALKEADNLNTLDADRAEPNVCDSDNINPCDF